MKKEHWAKTRKIKKEKKEKNIFLRTIYWVLVFLFVCVVIYIFLFSNFVKISVVELRGTQQVSSDEVYAEIKNLMSGNFLWIFPKDNFFLISQKRISDGLMEKFKKINEVSLEKKFPGHVKVVVKERDFLFLWCLSGQECYILDKDGYAKQKADFNSEFIKQNSLIRVDNLNSQSVKLGDRVLERDYIDFVKNVDEAFGKVLGMDTRSVYETRSRVSGDIIITSPEGWKVYLSSEFSALENANLLKTVLDKQVSGQERVDLEYVDLRSGSKAYYKLKSLEKEEDVEDTKEENGENEKNTEGEENIE